MNHFEIHPQLLGDCHALGRLTLCHLLLHKNAAVPWFILVPEVGTADLLDLAREQRNAALDEAAVISDFVKQELGCAKINFAAIGNAVPQLHLHIVGRRPEDACWPAPVWGHLPSGPEYSPPQIAEIIDALRRRCSLQLCKPFSAAPKPK